MLIVGNGGAQSKRVTRSPSDMGTPAPPPFLEVEDFIDDVRPPLLILAFPTVSEPIITGQAAIVDKDDEVEDEDKGGGGEERLPAPVWAELVSLSSDVVVDRPDDGGVISVDTFDEEDGAELDDREEIEYPEVVELIVLLCPDVGSPPIALSGLLASRSRHRPQP